MASLGSSKRAESDPISNRFLISSGAILGQGQRFHKGPEYIYFLGTQGSRSSRCILGVRMFPERRNTEVLRKGTLLKLYPTRDLVQQAPIVGCPWQPTIRAWKLKTKSFDWFVCFSF